jgi:hypothetical protein
MLYLYAKPPNMKQIQAFFFLVVLVMAQASAQNVGIGTNNPQARLHIAGLNPVLRLDGNGRINMYHSPWSSFTSLHNIDGHAILENTNSSGGILIRPGYGGAGSKEVVINNVGILIAPRDISEPNPLLFPTAPLDIRADGEVVRITGTNPYISIFSQGVQRGYIQGYTGGLALGSQNADVNIWTNGINRLSVKNNGALAIAGTAGSPGQVLTSSGPGGSPYWGSPGNVIYNSFRFITLESGVLIPRNGQWRDITGLQYSFTLGSNHYVDVSAQVGVSNCFRCPTGRCVLGLFVDGNKFTVYPSNDIPESSTSLALNTGFTLPAGNHTIQWRMACWGGGSNSDYFSILSNSFEQNITHMKVWMVPQ